MTAADLIVVLRSLSMVRGGQGRDLRARCLACAAVELEELTDEELALVGLNSLAEEKARRRERERLPLPSLPAPLRRTRITD